MVNIRAVAAIVFAGLLSGCATIAGGGSSQPLSLQSSPGAATYSVRSSAGLEMAQGSTPATIALPRRNDYQIEISMPGYQTQSMVLTRSINGWIWGNLFVGWIIGFAIDFLSGSAYKLEPAFVQVTLQRTGAQTGALIQFLDAERRVVDERLLPLIPLSNDITERGGDL